MTPQELRKGLPLARASLLRRYVRYLDDAGAPVDRVLACSQVPAALLEHSTAAIPLESAFRFVELACRMLGTEHLGLYVGLASMLEELGYFGRVLQNAVTVHEYLRKGIALYKLLMTGQRVWLSEDGREYRLNIATVGSSRLGTYQSQVETLAVTIAKLKAAAAPDWCPREICLAYKTREDLPNIDLFAGSRVVRGTGRSYVTISRSVMERRFSGASGGDPIGDPGSPAESPLPQALGGLVELQIESLLSDGVFQIDTIAETLGMSRRSLQRALAQEGLSYSQVLTDARVHRAADWLENTDKPIAEIAFDLGYTDASNFTRAFRRHTGVPPQAFRDNARNDERLVDVAHKRSPKNRPSSL